MSCWNANGKNYETQDNQVKNQTKKKEINMSKKIKNYINLFHESINSLDEISKYAARLTTIQDTIFPERLQDTNGFFFARPTEYIVPKNWALTDPCTVTIYRNAAVDVLSDQIFNRGTADDVKTFCCPYFNENKPCTAACKYQPLNNEYMEITKKLSDARARHDAIVAQRHAAWKQIFSRNAK